jgi:type I restriction enzyme S subunit
MSRPATQHKRATYPVYRPSGIEWLGEIPEHWEVRKFKSCAWFQEGPGLRNWQFTDGGVRVICVTNITESGIDFSIYQKYISEEEYESGYKRFTVQKGDLLLLFTVFPRDVLITTRGTIGRCALLPDDAGKGILHPCLMRVQPDPAIASSEYIALLIQDSGIALLQLQLLSNATTIEVIYSESLKSVRLPLPPVPE